LKKKNKFKKFSLKVRNLIIKYGYSSKCSHLGSSLSIVDILSVLYNQFLKKNKNSFVLSKGHACLALYCTLKEKKLISEKTLNTFGKNNSILMSHTTHKINGVELSTGSLGHGLPVACGIALANKIKKKNIKTFVLLSDGELDEGSNWEALLFSSHQKLKNLIIIVDYNKLQSMDSIKNTINLEPINKKFQSFGCKTININGHDFSQIIKAINTKTSKPLVIIANTIKGKGVKFMENSVLWHYKPLDKDHYIKAKNILK
tara:strand:- start:158 stop:934 length:777 start_codon:yes stop_codon:yes gene_type:complete